MNLLKKNLTRSTEELTESRADRIVSSAETAAKTRVMNLENDLNKLNDKLDKLVDMSADARTTTRNVIDKLEADEWFKEYCDLKKEIKLKTIDYNIAKESFEELFAEVEEDA